MNTSFRNFYTLILLFVTSLTYSQVPQDLIDKAKAAGFTDAQIQEEITKLKQQAVQTPENTTYQQQVVSDRYSTLDVSGREVLPIELQREQNMSPEDLSNTVFGREIFTNRMLTFEPDLNIPTPRDYRLSAGDELIINVWGDSEMNQTVDISPDGTIIIPGIGPISVGGLTIETAENRIRQALGRIMSNIQGESATTFVTVSLGRIRSIKVHIVGEAVAPGTYTLPSVATLFNALYAAGGVNDIGSLRTIRLFRNNKEVTSLDVYEYLLKGKYSSNLRLEDNDMIIIGPYEQLVVASGKLKRNRIFEVKEGETLQQVIEMAGGFTGDAYTSDVQIKRRTGERYRIATVTRDKFTTFAMHDGDSLVVDSVIPFYENRLTVTGAVWRPGEYELNENVNTVKTLIEQAKGLKGDEFMGRAQITRLNPDFTNSVIAVDIRRIMNGTAPDIILIPEDILHIPSLFDLREAYTIKVSGAVNMPDTILPYRHNMTVEDAIILAGGLSEAASTINVEVARRIKNTTSVVSTNRIAEEYTFTLNENMEVISGEEVFTLQPFDEVFVRFSPGYSTQQVVTIGGEVTFAGNYVLSEKNSRLSDIIAKAGGVTADAYVKGASLKRVLTEDELRRLETLLKLTMQQDGLDSIAPSAIEMTNYSVGIDLTKALANPGSPDDLVLRDGDELFIPQLQSTVKVSGSVTYPNSVTYTRRMSVRDCLSQAGGYNDIARKYPIVVYMNGKVATTKRTAIFFKTYPKVEPGCEILVPTKTQRERRISTAEILSISSSTVSMAAMITSIMNTIKNNNNK